MRKSPLEGCKVLDLGRYIAGPFCAMLLGDMGADVIKVEQTNGDDGRRMKPAIGDLSTYFMISNRNKRSITLNFKQPAGKEILLKLIRQADVLVENFRPGVLERLGLDYQHLHEVNPRLVMVSVTGFGQDGPYAQRPAFDSVAQAMGGLMNQTGDPDGRPVPAGTWVGDYGAGTYAAYGAALALLERERTGLGQHVDVALLDTIFSWLRTSVPDFLLFGIKHSRKGARDLYRCPVGAFPTSDGYIYITATTQGQFEGVVRSAGHPELAADSRFITESDRLANSAELNRIVTEWTSAHPGEEILAALTAADVPCAPIADIEQVVNNPQLKHRQNIVTVKTSGGQELPLPGIPVKLSETPGSVRLAPPATGEHNEEVYGSMLGMSKADLDVLRQQGVI